MPGKFLCFAEVAVDGTCMPGQKAERDDTHGLALASPRCISASPNHGESGRLKCFIAATYTVVNMFR